MLQEERMREIIIDCMEETMARFSSYERTIQTRKHGGRIDGRLLTYY